MLLRDVNPFIRFAEELVYVPSGKRVCPGDNRIFQVISGSGKIVIQNETYPLKEHTFVMINAGYPYQIVSSELLKMIVLNFDLNYERSNIESFIAVINDCDSPGNCYEKRDAIDDCPTLNDPVITENIGVAEHKLREIMQVYSARKRYFREQSSCLLKELLISVASNSTAENSRAGSVSAELIQYLQKHHSENISSDELARRFNYHVRHLNRLMRAEVGTTIHQYLLNYRISVSKGLLIKSECSIEQIAIDVGFDTLAHFSNAFKKSVGCSPAAYRKHYTQFI